MLLKTTFYLARECTEKLGLSELAVQEKHEAFCGQFPDGTNCTYCLYHGITLLYMFTVHAEEMSGLIQTFCGIFPDSRVCVITLLILLVEQRSMQLLYLAGKTENYRQWYRQNLAILILCRAKVNSFQIVHSSKTDCTIAGTDRKQITLKQTDF